MDHIRLPLAGGASFTQNNYVESPTRIIDSRYSARVSDLSSSLKFGENFRANYPGYYSRHEGQSKGQNVNGQFSGSWKLLHYRKPARFMLINPKISYSSQSRYSNRDTEQFILVLVDPDNQAVDRYTRIPRAEKRIYRQDAYSSSLELGIGWGRIYEATTTWHTIELLKTVRRQSSAPLEDITQADYQRLADVLYELRVTKYPSQDRTRLSAFDGTEQVLQVLQDVLGDSALAPRTIATVHDILRFYPQVSRRFGRKIYISITPGATYLRNYSETETDTETFNYLGGLADSNLYSYTTGIDQLRSTDTQTGLTATLRAGIVSRTPLDNDWQLDWEGSIDYYQRWANYSSSGYGFYGLTKTDTLGLYDWEREMDAWPRTAWNFNFNYNFALTHIISNRTYWTIGMGIISEPYRSSNSRIVLMGQDDQEGQYEIDRQFKYRIAQADASFNWRHHLAWQTYINVASGLKFNYYRSRYTKSTWRDTENWTITPHGSINLSHYF